MMKILKYIIVLTVVSYSFTACEEVDFGNAALEQPPSITVNKDSVFARLDYAERFLFGAYNTLPYGLNVNWDADKNKLGVDILEGLTDLNHSYLAWGGINQLYYNGQYNAGTENVSNANSASTKFHYTRENTWVGIRNGWIFVENAKDIPDTEEDYRNQMIGEAKMLIAIHYVDMFRHFGGLPWVDHSYTPTESTDLPRLTAKQTLENIIALIDEAVVDLPWNIEDTSNWDGRFTQASAMGLKARLLLFAASPLFNDDAPYLDGEAASSELVWFGSKDPALWNRAADAAEELINASLNNGNYAILNTGNPRQDFQDAYYKRQSSEMLISTRNRFTSPDEWNKGYYFYQSAGHYGTSCPTQEYVDMFGMANGLDITDPASGYDPTNPFVNRDPRLYETVLVNGDSYQGRTAELWIGGTERQNLNFDGVKTGYGLRKFLLEKNTATSINSVIHWPYLRLSEIYLSAAEALNEANSGPTVKAYQYINTIRSRAGLGDLQENLSQTDFREAVLKERALEFGWEEVRWYDLIRWKKEADFVKPLHGTDITLEDGAFVRTLFPCPDRFWKNNWSPKWYLSAFPPDEVNKGYGLIQNPGW
jgi:hypothetical protein